MFVPNALLVDAHTLNSEKTVFVGEPSRIQLVVRDDPEKEESDGDGKYTRGEENNLPWRDGGSIFPCAHGNAVCNGAADDLPNAVEAEPDACAVSLLFACVPLV